MRCKYAEKLADTLMKRYPKADQYPYKSWTYPQGFMLWGMARLWQKNGEQKYYDYIMEYVNGHINADGKIPKFTGNSMDDMMAGSIIVWAYQQTKEPCFKKACEQIREAFCDYPRNNNGGFWHGKDLPYEMWVDGVFMGQMFLSKYGAYLASSTEAEGCFDEAVRQLGIIYDCCSKEGTGLIYHAWCQDKKASWADPVTGRSPEIWSEGLGWYALIIIEVLDILPEGHPQYQKIARQYLELMESLKETQDPSSGLWYQVVDKQDKEGNWCDTSGSAMFLYSMQKGIEIGMLDPSTYHEVIRKGYLGLISKMQEDENGLLDIYDACEGLCVQNSYDDYVNYPKTVNAQEAVAACLWAIVEIEYAEKEK
ncbi:Unsaturated rhamnogalacturonyl hydrolase YteR [uncultured Ruminococcus sp.]|nr:Unsaturated rhamnogalacturonyl hydrolase YteR [uncultured Ruminococcus sp.]SCI19703.1 Unsaturated rhamnogalacturonyl hydrolase YteR [uncultured Clostridium sp.]